jgi:hypothetical protein
MHCHFLGRLVSFGVLLASVSLVSSPTPASAENLALGKGVWTNRAWDSNAASNAVDGNLDTAWNAGDCATLANSYWLTVDLGADYPVDSIALTGSYTHGQYEGSTVDYMLFGCADGCDWGDPLAIGTLVDTADMSQRSNTIAADGRALRYVWFIATGGTQWANLAEIQVNATVPEPSTFALLCIAVFGVLARVKRGRR